MKKYDEKREDQINALLDGELSVGDADSLKARATDDRELAQAIVEAWQLQQVMDDIHVERAPESLRKRLHAIPGESRQKSISRLLQPRWVAALAAIPLVIVIASLLQPDTPTASEIARARQDMVIAFTYLDKAGVMTGREIESTVGQVMANAVTNSVNRAIQSQNLTPKEKEI